MCSRQKKQVERAQGRWDPQETQVQWGWRQSTDERGPGPPLLEGRVGWTLGLVLKGILEGFEQRRDTGNLPAQDHPGARLRII